MNNKYKNDAIHGTPNSVHPQPMALSIRKNIPQMGVEMIPHIKTSYAEL